MLDGGKSYLRNIASENECSKIQNKVQWTSQ